MRPAFPIPQRAIRTSHGNCETLWLQCHKQSQVKAPMAPKARQALRGRRRMVALSTPPSAATGEFDERARRIQRITPSDDAPGWLGVAKTGDRKIRSAPACRARRSSTRLCAELVTRPPAGRIAPGQRPARRCTPAPRAAANLVSPATTSARRRRRQMRARSRPSSARCGSPSCRRTIPARPRGKRDAAGRGSGSRRASVNSHSGGRRRDDLALAARAQERRLASTVSPASHA
jgi:hypothetical protein